MIFINVLQTLAATSQSCLAEKSKTFFGLPVWYKYLDVTERAGQCAVNIDIKGSPNQIWLIALGIVDIILRLGGIVAVIYIMYGGFLYMTSQGEPDRTKKAKDAILGAIIGLVIVLMATQIVSFIGNRL